MSWLFGGGAPTPDQAQAAVSALQEQLIKRQERIENLEHCLEQEKNLHETLLREEIAELESRKARLQSELKNVTRVLKQKQRQLERGQGDEEELLEQQSSVEAEAKTADSDASDSDDDLMVDARFVCLFVCLLGRV